jgi:hypothetical protein
MRQLLLRSGKLGFLGERVDDVRVYQFSGGYLECNLEIESGGKFFSAGAVPEDWPAMLRRDESLKAALPDAVVREGVLVVAALQPRLTVVSALSPYFPHLGGMFGSGPAGPLHQLTSLHLEAWHPRPYRIFISVGPRGSNHGRFNLWSEHVLLIRQPIVPRPEDEEKPDEVIEENLSPGSKITLLDRRRGNSRLRLRARFLADREVEKLAK